MEKKNITIVSFAQSVANELDKIKMIIVEFRKEKRNGH